MDTLLRMHSLSYANHCHKEILNLTESHGVFVRVRGGIDVILGEAVWEFQTIDPATGTIVNTIGPTPRICL